MGACSGRGNGEKGRAKHEEKQHWRRLKESTGELRRINKVFGVTEHRGEGEREGRGTFPSAICGEITSSPL